MGAPGRGDLRSSLLRGLGRLNADISKPKQRVFSWWSLSMNLRHENGTDLVEMKLFQKDTRVSQSYHLTVETTDLEGMGISPGV